MHFRLLLFLNLQINYNGSDAMNSLFTVSVTLSRMIYILLWLMNTI